MPLKTIKKITKKIEPVREEPTEEEDFEEEAEITDETPSKEESPEEIEEIVEEFPREERLTDEEIRLYEAELRRAKAERNLEKAEERVEEVRRELIPYAARRPTLEELYEAAEEVRRGEVAPRVALRLYRTPEGDIIVGGQPLEELPEYARELIRGREPVVEVIYEPPTRAAIKEHLIRVYGERPLTVQRHLALMFPEEEEAPEPMMTQEEATERFFEIRKELLELPTLEERERQLEEREARLEGIEDEAKREAERRAIETERRAIEAEKRAIRARGMILYEELGTIHPYLPPHLQETAERILEEAGVVAPRGISPPILIEEPRERIPLGARPTGRTYKGKPVYVMPDGRYWVPE